jgi:nicotinate-nucleotide pyrophosphorylase (carboxylating)
MKAPMKLTSAHVRSLVRAALAEDLGILGDVTTMATIEKSSTSYAEIVAKEHGILCGLPLAIQAFRELDKRIKITLISNDGVSVKPGQVVLKIRGSTRSILSAERIALNFIQQLSGIATLTHQFVKQIKGTKTQILDTRKTTPLLRILEKYAVVCGGGVNHRLGLYDMVLIKDNHLAGLSKFSKPILEAISRSRKKWPKLMVEVECDTLAQVREAIEAHPDVILLDNMSLAQLRRAVDLVQGKSKTEASGNVSLKTVRAIAKTGVNFISVGALTHSAPSLDFSLQLRS